jgi:hypothetical protein
MLKTCPLVLRIYRFVSDRHKRAHVALEFIRNIAKHLGQACIDGIQAHEDAVLAAAQDVKFSNNHASDDMKCLKDRQAPARMTAAIMNRDFPEAARIQISIFATDTSGLNALKELDKCVCNSNSGGVGLHAACGTLRCMSRCP